MATNPYGLGHLNDGTETVLVGTAPWCVSKGSVRLTDLAWENDGGVKIAGFSVVNQRASADRIGSDRGELSALGLSENDREVTTRCADDSSSGPEMVSYVVLALRTPDPGRVTSGRGLVAFWDDGTGGTGEAVDDFSVAFCPQDSAACDYDSITAQ